MVYKLQLNKSKSRGVFSDLWVLYFARSTVSVLCSLVISCAVVGIFESLRDSNRCHRRFTFKHIYRILICKFPVLCEKETDDELKENDEFRILKYLKLKI